MNDKAEVKTGDRPIYGPLIDCEANAGSGQRKINFGVFVNFRLVISFCFSAVLILGGIFIFLFWAPAGDDFVKLSIISIGLFLILVGLMFLFSIVLEIYNFSNSKKHPYLKGRPVHEKETFLEFIKKGKAEELIDEYYLKIFGLKTFPFTASQMVALWFLPIVIIFVIMIAI